jgi:hypothetical protein
MLNYNKFIWKYIVFYQKKDFIISIEKNLLVWFTHFSKQNLIDNLNLVYNKKIGDLITSVNTTNI